MMGGRPCLAVYLDDAGDFRQNVVSQNDASHLIDVRLHPIANHVKQQDDALLPSRCRY